MGKNNARITDIATLMQAGIDPKTKLPLTALGVCDLENYMNISLRIKDEQEYVNRYEWFNLPNITGKELERIMYYKGSVMGFYYAPLEKFYFLPYTLTSAKGTGIDLYGRYLQVSPVPMGSTEDKDNNDTRKVLTRSIVRDVIYEVPLFETEEEAWNAVDSKCVLLYDYTPQLGRTLLPRQSLQDNLIKFQSEIIPFLRTALINSTGVRGMRVNNESDYSNVVAANRAKIASVKQGEGWIPVVSNIEFQDLDAGQTAQAVQFLEAYQAIDNLRSGLMGVGESAVFQKSQHILQSENDMNVGTTRMLLEDGLKQRQQFCVLFNNLFGTNIWCDIASDNQEMGGPNEQEEDMTSDNEEESYGGELSDE